MKRFTLILCSTILVYCSAFAAPKLKWNQRFQDYFDRYKDMAIEEMLKYGIPASITLAQGVLESGAGQSELALKGNNHFGIKCHGWEGRTIYHDDDLRGECFRAYDSVIESYEDHSRFLSGRQRYSSLFQLSRTDYRGWAHGLKRAGYATNPVYAQKLIDIIEVYKLYEYDKATSSNRRRQTDERKPEVERPQSEPVYDYDAHVLKAFNDNYYINVRRGDTFKSLGKEFDISARKLARYNERKASDRLNPGEIIWLKKKQKRAPKQFKKCPHVVGSSESLYDIAQKYGIRLKSLVKKNRRLAEDGLRVGDKVRIY